MADESPAERYSRYLDGASIRVGALLTAAGATIQYAILTGWIAAFTRATDAAIAAVERVGSWLADVVVGGLLGGAAGALDAVGASAADSWLLASTGPLAAPIAVLLAMTAIWLFLAAVDASTSIVRRDN